jgi:hypothetical protein
MRIARWLALPVALLSAAFTSSLARTDTDHDAQLVERRGGFGSETGTVTTGEIITFPVPGVAVSIPELGMTALTDDSGVYLLDPVPVGAYFITTELLGFCPAVRSVLVADELQSVVDIVIVTAAFADPFEVASGWTVGAPGDDATDGIWARVDPNGTGAPPVQPEDDNTPEPGTVCFITGQAPVGGTPEEGDVDGGRTTLLSPVFDLGIFEEPVVRFYRWFFTDEPATPDDIFEVYVSGNGGASFSLAHAESASDPEWVQIEIFLADFVTPTNEVQFAVVAGDLGSPSIVEVGIDDFSVCSSPIVGVGPGNVQSPSRLLPAVPNPFRRSVVIPFALAEAGRARVDIFDVAGGLVRRLADAPMDIGIQHLTWDGRDDDGRRLSPGVYFYRLETPGRVATRKLVMSN